MRLRQWLHTLQLADCPPDNNHDDDGDDDNDDDNDNDNNDDDEGKGGHVNFVDAKVRIWIHLYFMWCEE